MYYYFNCICQRHPFILIHCYIILTRFTIFHNKSLFKTSSSLFLTLNRQMDKSISLGHCLKKEIINDETISINFEKQLIICNKSKHRNTTTNPLKYELISYVNNFNKNSSISYGGSLPLGQISQVPAVIIQSSPIWRYDKFVDPKVLSNSSPFTKLMESKDNNNF